MPEDELKKDLEFDTLYSRFVRGVALLDQNDRDYLLDKIEESRWTSSPTYNRGVHLLLDVVQYAVETSYVSPNKRFRKW